jgi:hypothetical protein
VRENLLLGAGADISVPERTLLALDADFKWGVWRSYGLLGFQSYCDSFTRSLQEWVMGTFYVFDREREGRMRRMRWRLRILLDMEPGFGPLDLRLLT